MWSRTHSCIPNRISKHCLYSVEDFTSPFWKVYYRLMVTTGKLDSTVTPLGKKLLHTWHLRPLLDLSEISARHDAVEFFSSAENAPIMTSLRKTMKGVRNVPAHCTKLQTGRGSYVEWKCLVDVSDVVNLWHTGGEKLLRSEFFNRL